jgi:hypothetical protein
LISRFLHVFTKFSMYIIMYMVLLIIRWFLLFFFRRSRFPMMEFLDFPLFL